MYIALISAHALGLSGMHFFTCIKAQWNGKHNLLFKFCCNRQNGTESYKSQTELLSTRRTVLRKECSSVAVLHHHFRTAVYLFLLPRESFHSNKSESEDFISEPQLLFFFLPSPQYNCNDLQGKTEASLFFARVQWLLSRGVRPAVNLPVSRSHPLPDIHSRHVWHTDSLHLQRRDGQYPLQHKHFSSLPLCRCVEGFS